MAKSQHFQIPENVRELAERNVAEARQTYERFTGLAREAGQPLARAHGEMAASAIELQSAALGFAEDHIAAGLDFAARMARAGDMAELLKLQAEFAQAQVDAVNRQSQDLCRMLAEAAGRTAKASR